MRVIFRKWRTAPHTVIAWLPDIEATSGRCMSYEHVGQHGEGIYPADTVPATATEYAALLAELTRVYSPETLRPVLKLSHWQVRL